MSSRVVKQFVRAIVGTRTAVVVHCQVAGLASILLPALSQRTDRLILEVESAEMVEIASRVLGLARWIVVADGAGEDAVPLFSSETGSDSPGLQRGAATGSAANLTAPRLRPPPVDAGLPA